MNKKLKWFQKEEKNTTDIFDFHKNFFYLFFFFYKIVDFWFGFTYESDRDKKENRN